MKLIADRWSVDYRTDD